MDLIFDKLARKAMFSHEFDKCAFDNDSVKSLIEIRWSLIRKRIFQTKMGQNVFFMIVFYLYTIYDLFTEYHVIMNGLNQYAILCKVTLYILSVYLIIFEAW
jgi:hypothetical protein